MYGRGRNGSLIAVDAKTGKEIWIREGMQAMTARGMNYWENKDGKDRRLIFAMNDYLQEINAATGQPVYEFGKDGVVDLREGLGRDPATIGRIQSGTPGRVFENLILLGSATGEGYMSPPGDLRAFDILTGKLCGSSTRCLTPASSGTTRGPSTPTSTLAAFRSPVASGVSRKPPCVSGPHPCPYSVGNRRRGQAECFISSS